jgi:hypothetical protein
MRRNVELAAAYCRAVALESILILDIDANNVHRVLVRLPPLHPQLISEQLNVHQGYQAFKTGIDKRILAGDYVGGPSVTGLYCERRASMFDGTEVLRWTPVLGSFGSAP